MSTVQLVRDNSEAVKAKFGDEAIIYTNVSHTQLSIARHYGGCKVQGKDFVYDPTDDSLIRGDVLKFLKKIKKSAASVAAKCPCETASPCDPMCSCVDSVSSRGCERCARYGSPEQQIRAEVAASVSEGKGGENGQ